MHYKTWLKRDFASFLKRMQLGTGHSFRDSVVQHNRSMGSTKMCRTVAAKTPSLFDLWIVASMRFGFRPCIKTSHPSCAKRSAVCCARQRGVRKFPSFPLFRRRAIAARHSKPVATICIVFRTLRNSSSHM